MSTTDTDIERFLSGAGAPHFKYETVGQVHRGKVTEFTTGQCTVFGSNPVQLATWPDGNPKMQLILTLETDERDAGIDDDDGTRRDFLPKPSAKLTALIEAIKAAGCKLEKGMLYAMQYTGDGIATKGNPPKEYKCQVKAAPAASISIDDLL